MAIIEKKKELMQKGMLTKEDIMKGKEKKKTKELKANPIVQEILEYKRQGISDSEISRMNGIKINQPEVSKYVRDCVKLGLITREEIEIAKKKKEEKNKNDNPNRKKVLEGLRLGKLDTEIAENTTVGYQQVKNIRLSLIEEGVITQEEVDEARQNAKIDRKQQENREYRERREIEDKEKVLEGLKSGMSQREIAKCIDTSLARTQTYIKKIKEEQEISDEDILRWKSEQETSLEKRKAAVLEGLRQGLTRKEIVQKYPKQELKTMDVKNYRDILIREGVISEEEIIKYRKLREKKRKETKSELTDSEREVLNYLRRGYKAKEIACLTNKSVSGTLQ